MATNTRPAPTKHELESWLEARLRRKVRLIGGRLYKLAPTEKGIPDRLVLLPGGRMYLVELKADWGELSPKQKLLHEQLAELGTEVIVLTGSSGVDRWVNRQAGYLDEPETTRRYRPRKVQST